MVLGKWFTGARDRGGEKRKRSVHHTDAVSVFCIHVFLEEIFVCEIF